MAERGSRLTQRGEAIAERIARDAVHVGRLIAKGDFRSLEMLCRRIHRNARQVGIEVPPESEEWANRHSSILRGEDEVDLPEVTPPHDGGPAMRPHTIPGWWQVWSGGICVALLRPEDVPAEVPRG